MAKYVYFEEGEDPTPEDVQRSELLEGRLREGFVRIRQLLVCSPRIPLSMANTSRSSPERRCASGRLSTRGRTPPSPTPANASLSTSLPSANLPCSITRATYATIPWRRSSFLATDAMLWHRSWPICTHSPAPCGRSARFLYALTCWHIVKLLTIAAIPSQCRRRQEETAPQVGPGRGGNVAKRRGERRAVAQEVEQHLQLLVQREPHGLRRAAGGVGAVHEAHCRRAEVSRATSQLREFH